MMDDMPELSSSERMVLLGLYRSSKNGLTLTTKELAAELKLPLEEVWTAIERLEDIGYVAPTRDRKKN